MYVVEIAATPAAEVVVVRVEVRVVAYRSESFDRLQEFDPHEFR